jgi:hypothetical protein
MEYNPPHDMIFVSVESARHIFSPSFFEDSVNQHTCLLYAERMVNADTWTEESDW